MRKKMRREIPLMARTVDHPHAKELDAISDILDTNPIIYELALQDLGSRVTNPGRGAEGMTAEQVVRAAIIKQMEDYSYEELGFHLVDSNCYRKFCRIGIVDKGFKKSALCSNIKALCAETWEAINRVITGHAKKKGIENGRKVRLDCTVVSSNIHDPTDSSLLWDSVRVITRILTQAKMEFEGLSILFADHTRTAKRRMLGVMNAKNEKSRNRQYKDLLEIAHRTVGYAQRAMPLLETYRCADPLQLIRVQATAKELKRYIQLSLRVIDQTQRRVIHGEFVDASEKVVSIFEPHTDIIVKDRRDTFYGHKVCLTGGTSKLILDCAILEGNPADVTLTNQMFDRHKEIYGRYPLKAALDGGFASKANLQSAKSKGIKDVCFARKRGIEVEDMCRSKWVYKRLRRFRAGIESGISWLKRCFGFARCTWRTLPSFRSYVWVSVVCANLLTLARTELA